METYDFIMNLFGRGRGHGRGGVCTNTELLGRESMQLCSGSLGKVRA